MVRAIRGCWPGQRARATRPGISALTAMADEADAPPAQDIVIGFRTAQHPQPIRAIFRKTAAEVNAAVKHLDRVMARCDKVVEVAGKPELLEWVFR